MATPLPTVKSCSNCPSLVLQEDVVKMYRATAGSAMCARYGRVLDRPTLSQEQNEQARMAIAGSCGSYGQPRMAGMTAGMEKTEVMLPDPAVMMNKPSPGDPNHTKVVNCKMCTHYVGSDVVRRETGWTSGFCRAKGKLILDSRVKPNASLCDMKFFAPGRRDLEDMHMFPEYTDQFALASDPLAKHFADEAAGLQEPEFYKTDIPVEPADAEQGIIAWRRIVDAEDTSRHVFLPIFDRESIPEHDRPKIPRMTDDEFPQGYIDHANLVYTLTALWTEMDETPALWGEPGVGKTELFRHMAWLMGLPFIRISVTRSSELDDLAGKSTFTAGVGTAFKYGRLVHAWMSKAVVCLDEPNAGPTDVWQFLRPLTDNSKQMALDMNQGEIIPRNDNCFLGLAMNPDWDPRNRGAEQIADADGSRLAHVWVPSPPRELEKEIIRQRVKRDGWEITPKQLKTIMDIGEELRKLSDDGELSVSWGVRSQIKVARMLRWFGLLRAYGRASADYLEPSQRDVMLDIVKAHNA